MLYLSKCKYFTLRIKLLKSIAIEKPILGGSDDCKSRVNFKDIKLSTLDDVKRPLKVRVKMVEIFKSSDKNLKCRNLSTSKTVYLCNCE